MRSGELRLLSLIALLMLLCSLSACAQVPQTFTIKEHFGVSHPDQIVDFDLTRPVDAANTRVVDAEGAEVPYQLLEGGKRLAVRTNLPAGGEKSWRLEAGRPAFGNAGAVIVTERPTYYEITNGITGLRVTKALETVGEGTDLPAPVQGVLMRDGTWTGEGRNSLIYQSGADSTRQTVPTAMKVDFLERGPLVVVVRVTYEFTTPAYYYGQQEIRPAGPGFYTCTIRFEAGQPSVLFEEDTDIEPKWSLDFYEAVRPTNARYRGHHASRAEYGYEADGRTYRQWHERPDLDAQVDLTYDRPRTSFYVTNADHWRWMSVWDPWAVDTGWYWQLFDANAGPESNLVGIFAGKASRALAAGFSGTGLYTLPAADGAPPRAGFAVQSYRRDAAGRISPRSRYQWGLFLGVKGEDLRDPRETQPINLQMNLHGGVSLNDIQRLTLDFPDPPQGYGAIYVAKEVTDARIKRMQEDEDYFRWCYNVDPYTRPLMDAWKDGTAAGMAKIMEPINTEAQGILDQLVNQGGIYGFKYHYWHGGLAMSRLLTYIDQVLASDLASPEQKRVAKATAVLFAGILWDDDFVPLFEGHRLNLGTENMPVQQQNYREMYALYLATHPDFAERAQQVWPNAQRMLHANVNAEGSHMGSSHYIGAAMGPLLSTLQQLQMSGLADPFQAEPRMREYAEFELNFLTPPDPRFNNERKRPAIGDAPPGEATEFWGQLGTAFAKQDPDLSARLMGAWHQSGRPHSAFHGSTQFKIDETLPSEDPGLSSAHRAGWYSVLRTGWATANEDAVWFVNGDWYRDHAHNDLGEVVIFAHNAPLSLDFGSFYSPHAPGGLLHSVVLPLAEVAESWNQVTPPGYDGGRWRQPEQEAFEGGADGGFSRTRFSRGEMTWTRAVSLAAPAPEVAVFGVQDVFGGAEAGAAKVFSLNFMSTGPVQTPEGPKTPGQSFTLQPGVRSLGFVGQTFEQHANQGIDWELFVLADRPIQGFLAEWSHQNVSPETQTLLRLRSEGPFRLAIVAWPKGARPDDLQVQAEGTGAEATLLIHTAGKALRLTPEGKLQ